MLKTTLISKRAIISTLQPLVANRVYTVRQGLAKGLTRRGGLGFVPRVGAKPLEEAFLETLDFTDEIVYDVGGYEGIFTLFFASRVGRNGHVVTFEPNPANYARIIENVRLNGFTNVTVRRMALGRGAGHGSLVFPTDETARGTLLSDIQDQIWQEPHVDVIEVDIDSIDRELSAAPCHRASSSWMWRDSSATCSRACRSCWRGTIRGCISKSTAPPLTGSWRTRRRSSRICGRLAIACCTWKADERSPHPSTSLRQLKVTCIAAEQTTRALTSTHSHCDCAPELCAGRHRASDD